MKTQQIVSPERIQQLRDRSHAVREQDYMERQHVVSEFKEIMKEWQRVVASHSVQIDEYIKKHGEMTRAEVIDKALTKLLTE